MLSGDSCIRKKLVLITSLYPYGYGEPFINAELDALSKKYESIDIIPMIFDDSNIRKIPNNCRIKFFSAKSTIFQKLKIPYLLCVNFSLLCNLIRNEKKTVLEIYNLKWSWEIYRKMFHDLIKGLQLFEFLKKITNKEESVFYSYWLNNAALALSLYKRYDPSSICVARSHRHDLYFENEPFEYLSFQRDKANILDRIFFISENGRSYFLEKTKCNKEKLLVSKLGTFCPLPVEGQKRYNRIVIVSCSNMSPIKRIPLLIKALSFVNLPLIWFHIGDGYMKPDYEAMACESFSEKENVEYHFLGQMSNKKVHEFYAKNYIDLFINVSESEGLPVSLMEAVSYGIPIMATDVGGSTEICNDITGVLLPPDISALALSEAISQFVKRGYSKSDRDKIVSFWEKNYSANINYEQFIREIENLYC